jgi:thiosulfate/3-mercaptopyruvate sulfurtransferase
VDVAIEDVVPRLGEEGFVVLDVRSSGEYAGAAVAPCDPRPGRIPGARHLDIQELMLLTQDEIRERLGPADGVEVVAYCHSGSRSQLATEILCAAGYRAFNYRGSWHEWSRDETLPAETGAP